jgi:hypothetical protein
MPDADGPFPLVLVMQGRGGVEETIQDQTRRVAEGGFVAAAGGKITGPRLQGKVISNSGGDWALYRDDHTVQFSARYMLEAEDGTQIYMQNTGYRHAPPDVAARMEALEQVDPSEYYFRITPTFETPIGKHDWLTRTLIIGSAHRHAEHSIFTYYAVL